MLKKMLMEHLELVVMQQPRTKAKDIKEAKIIQEIKMERVFQKVILVSSRIISKTSLLYL
jgi:hypothetical protein